MLTFSSRSICGAAYVMPVPQYAGLTLSRQQAYDYLNILVHIRSLRL